MFDHVTIRAADRDASVAFYDTVLAALDIAVGERGDEFVEWDDFSVAQAGPEHPATHGLHVAFSARSREQADAFWRAGVDAGHRDDGAPGPRPEYGPDYYGAFLLDPDGNSAEAVHHDASRAGGIDHLWIRVADVARARAFYATIAAHAGLERGTDRPDRVQFRGAGGSFSLVKGEPTRHLHLAFPGSRDAVDGFHREALRAGYRDNGAPGERPRYHDGYYAAFVLDPDGTNVEVVDHGRR